MDTAFAHRRKSVHDEGDFAMTNTALQRGMTLIELLVAMVIALVLTLAVTSIVIVGESHRRTTTSTNDMNQAGSYAAATIDRTVRSAGSGFIQSFNQGVFGCRLNVGTMLPRASAFPVPFTNFLAGATTTLTVAPLLIAKNQSAAGSDVLVVMSGNGAAGDVPRRLTDPGDATTLRLETAVGFAANDLVLVSQSGVPNCLLEPVASTTASNLVLNTSGSYYTVGTANKLADLAISTSANPAYVTLLGNSTAANVQMQLIGVGNNNTLFSYDLLRATGTDTSQAIADGVLELHAAYGVDSNDDGLLDTWADPGAAGYTIDAIMNPTTGATTMRRIVAVRLALVMRSSTYEKQMVSPYQLTYFSDLTNAAGASLAGTVTLGTNAAAEDERRHYRYRVIETTIPLRNLLLMGNS